MARPRLQELILSAVAFTAVARGRPTASGSPAGDARSRYPRRICHIRGRVGAMTPAAAILTGSSPTETTPENPDHSGAGHCCSGHARAAGS